MKMSKGLPNIAFIFSLILILNIPVTYGQSLCDFPDVHVFPTGNPQSEVHISINPTNPNNLILGCNTYTNGYSSMGYFYSTDGGNSWSGSENLQDYTELTGDPSTAFDADNHAYVSTLNATGYGIVMQMSNNDGITWSNISNPVNGATSVDKDMIACDDDNSSPYHNNLYCGWTGASISSVPVLIDRSINYGQSFSNLTTFNINGRGVNIQTAPNGHVYVIWANYATPSSTPASGLGFSYSIDGGQTFSPPVTAFNYNGIASYAELPDPTFNYIRVNDYPSMAVDKSNGTNSGRIYVTYPEEVNSHAVIALRYSDDEGGTWSTPIILSNPNFRESFFPWISVDPTNGDIYVVYYAFDQLSGFSTNVYVAYSNNGGTTFQNIRVSDDSFTTAPINNTIFRPGYMGDYIGITAYDGEAWAAWMDNRNGTWQIYTSKVVPAVINGPSEICSSATYFIPNLPAGITVSWSASPSNIVSLSSNGNQVTVTKITNGTITLTASMSNSCQTQKNIQVLGTPSISQINIEENGPSCIEGQSLSFGATYNGDYGCDLLNDGITEVDWEIMSPQPYQVTDNAGFYECSSGSVINPGISLYFSPPATPFMLTLKARVKNECGEWSLWSPGYSFQISGCSAYPSLFSITPNPASGTITITSGSTNDQYSKIGVSGNNGFIKEVKIYTSAGKLAKQQQFSGNASQVQMDVSTLTPGIYFVEISNGQHAETHKLVIAGNSTLTK